MAEIELIEAEFKARRYATSPDEWASDVLNHHIWSVQRLILRALRYHRKVAVRSCHGAGKSFIAGVACGHWIATTPPGEAFIVTSAPTGPQVRAILWREIGRVHARGKLPGRVNQTEWFIPVGDEGREELVGFGRKPSDYSPDAFQGIHAPRVLVLFDEANGIPEVLWDAADSLTANDDSRMLVIGNPDDPDSHFAKICKPGSGWFVIEISAFITPNFTGEFVPHDVARQLVGKLYVEEKRKKWAANWSWTPDGSKCVPPEGVPDTDTHPYWQSKVLGRFPTVPEDPGLIPQHWVERAKQRVLPPTGDPVLGVDVGGGGDSSCGCLRRGGHFRIVFEDREPDTMVTAGNVIRHMKDTKATYVAVDMIGIGRGVRDRGLEQNYRFVGVNVGQAPLENPLDIVDEMVEYTQEQREDERFANLRAQLWWHVRTMFERNLIDIDPNDEELAEQLVSLRFKRRSDGRILIESKDDAKRRGVASPNRADALMLSCAPESIDDSLAGKATW